MRHRFLQVLTREMSSSTATKSGSSSLCRVVNASEIASGYSQEIKKAILAKSETSSSATTRPPKLVGFLVGSRDSPSATYASWTDKACQSVGIDFELRFIEPPREEQDIQENIKDDENKDADNVEQSGLEIGAADLETAILEANSDP